MDLIPSPDVYGLSGMDRPVQAAYEIFSADDVHPWLKQFTSGAPRGRAS